MKNFGHYIYNNRGSIRSSVKDLVYSVTESDFVKKVAETFTTRVLLIGIGLITSVIVARILGPQGRGLYAVAVTIGAIGVQFGNIGLHASNTYYVARDRTLLPALIGNTLIVSFGLGGFGATTIWIIFAFWPSLAPVRGLLLVLSLLWIPFGLAYLLFQNLLLGIQEVRAYNRIELITSILGVVFIGIVILVGVVSVESVFTAGLIVLIFAFLSILIVLRNHTSTFSMTSMSLFKKNIRYGFKAYLAAFFAFLVLRIDLLMVKYILDAEQAGYYAIAVGMADMIYVLPAVVGTILFPKLTAMLTSLDKWRNTKKVAFGMGLILIMVSVISYILSKPIIEIMFGHQFLPSVPAFLWLLPGIVFLGIQTITVQFLNSIGLPIMVIISWGFTFLLNILLNLFAIPAYGIMGASLASSVSYFTVFILIISTATWISSKNRSDMVSIER